MKRFISNHHTHNNFCDGKNTMEEMVKAAIDKGIRHFGISSHAPIKGEYWTLKTQDVSDYFNEINRLKDKYVDKITIYFGLEIDYFNGLGLNPLGLPYLDNLDYYIGSIHSISSGDPDDILFIDDALEVFEDGVKRLFDNDIKAVVECYYNSIMDMVIECEPTMVGHIDIIKKNNKGNRYFSEEEPWYKEIVKDTLQVIKKSKSIIEVNTGGIPRYGMDCLYPSQFILEEILKNEMDVTVNGDSHSIDTIDYYYDEIYKSLKDMGFEKTLVFSKEGWIPFSL